MPIRRELRQGDVISYKLFTLAVEDGFRTMELTNTGININKKKPNHRRYADDLVVIVFTSEKLLTMQTEPTREFRQIGLIMNYAKNKTMTNKQSMLKIRIRLRQHVARLKWTSQVITFGKRIIRGISRGREMTISGIHWKQKA